MKGFTLIELITVVVILAILAMVVTQGYQEVVNTKADPCEWHKVKDARFIFVCSERVGCNVTAHELAWADKIYAKYPRCFKQEELPE